MDLFLQQFGQYGLGGLVILGLGLAVRTLFDRYERVQNSRVEEGRETINVIKDNTASQNANTAAVKALGELIRTQRKE